MRNLFLLAVLSGCTTKLTDAPVNDGSDGLSSDDDDDDVGDDDDDDDDDGTACSCEAGETCVDSECLSCSPTVTWPDTTDASTIHLVARDDRPWEELSLLLRPMDVSQSGIAEWGAQLSVYDTDGGEHASGDSLDPDTYLVRGVSIGETTLTLRAPEACDDPIDHEVATQIHADRALAGRLLALAPFAERVHLFGPGDAVAILPDSVEHADRAQTATVHFVDDRTAAEWAVDASLASSSHSASIDLSAPSDAWTTLPTGAGVVGRYDVVVDIDGDGSLSAGDLVQGFDGPAIVVVGDLGAPGPYPVQEFEWSASFWITQKVYYPDDLANLDPIPIVIMSHGNGHDYRWYNYLGRHLASWGYVFMSHRNDTEPGPVAASRTTVDNTDALLARQATLQGGVLNGEMDTSRIAWLGHSRGGEGVVLAYDDLVDGAQNPSTYTEADIQLVSSVAPTIFQGPEAGNPNDVKYHLLAGSSDGDVTGGPDCDLCQYFRLFKNGTGEAWVTYFQGSTHNDFHDDVPGSFNDGIFVTGVKIGSARTQQGAKAYYLALLDHVLRDDAALDEYLERVPELFRPDGVDFVLSTQAFRSPTRTVIDDFQAESDLGTSSSGGTVSGTVVDRLEGLADDSNGTLNWTGSDGMNGMTWADQDGQNAERSTSFEWSADSQLDFSVPTGLADQSGATHLSFRAAQSTRHPNTVSLASMLSFTVALIDTNGTEVGFDSRAWGGIPQPARRTGNGNGSGWVNEFQTIRVPLEAFTANGRGINLSDLSTIRFQFGPTYGSSLGRIVLDDIEFITEASP